MRFSHLVLAALLVTGSARALPLEPHTAPSGVRWITGGVGSEERAALERTKRDYTLKIVFAEKAVTAYTADVHFAVRTDSGDVALEGDADGPWVLAALPPGTYTVEVTSRGERQSRRTTVGERGPEQVVFYFSR